MMNIDLKWFYRIGLLLLTSALLYLIFLLRPVWLELFHLIWFSSIPFLVAIFISYLIYPLLLLLEKQGLKKWMAIALIYIVFFGVIGLAIYKGLPLLFEQVKAFASGSPDLVQDYRHFFARFEKQTAQLPFGLDNKMEEIVNYMENRMLHQIENYGKGLAAFPGFLIMLTIIPFVTFYILRDYEKIKAFFYNLIPKKWRESSSHFMRDLDRSLGSYIRGLLMLSVLIGVLTYIVFLFFRMKYSLLLSVIIGITNIIPTFGPIIGAIPAVLIALTISKAMVIKVLVTIVVLQIVEGNLLAPVVMGKSLHMHPLVIMVALVLGEEIGGLLGLVFSVPILAVLRVFYIHAKVHFGRKRSDEGTTGELP